jgi:glycosyltransferase involved in cell wall biosynthesis
MAKITVILCTYDRHQSLAKALESIAASKLPDSIEWETLVVDNNSTDRTREVVGDFCRRYPGRFRYLFEPLQGKSYALNSGIRESRGTILAFADDDATVEPDWLWNLTSALHDGKWAGAGGRIIPVWPAPLPRWLSTEDPNTMGPYVAFDLGMEAGQLTRPPYGANMAFRREQFEEYGGFRIDVGPRPREDIEFAQRLLTGGERLRYEPRAVVHHPVTEDRMTKGYVLRWWFSYGYSEVVESRQQSDSRWILCRVPIYLLRRLLRWTLQWMVSFRAPRRFSCKRAVWYIAGTVLACYQLPQCHNTRVPTVAKSRNKHPDGTPSQADAPQ